MTDSSYWLGFNLIPGIGPAKFRLLQSYFGDLALAWEANAVDLAAAGLDSRSVNAILARRPKISLEAEREKLERYKVKAFTWDDPAYPARLKEIYDPPPVLYVRGTLASEDEWAIAVVGTRRASVYGREVAERIVSSLASNGITIISGLAKGIDSVAHRAALDTRGRTVAVQACGLDMVYPADNLKLAQSITENGALLSEFSLGSRPKAENFPRRNRIMSGMSLGVLVTEAGTTSGAMITAHLALEQNREVFAIPGSILSPTSGGTNELIKEGAKLVQGYMDILEELNLTAATHQMEFREVVPTTDTESRLLAHLGTEPTHIDEVCRASELPIPEVSSTLALLELKGLVRQVGAMSYVLAREAREEFKVKVD